MTLKQKNKLIGLGMSILMLMAVFPVVAWGVPGLINYQGYLTDAQGKAVNGNVALTCRIWDDENGGTEVWSESHAAVTVSNGVFDVLLGSSVPLDEDILNGDRYLGLTVGGDPEMRPRMRVTSAAYAIRAAFAERVAAGAVDGNALSDMAVTEPKISAGAVSAEKLAIGSVTAEKVAEGTLTKDKFKAAGGTSGQILGTDGTNLFWQDPAGGDITGVTAGSGLTGGGMSGEVTLNVGGGTGILVNDDSVAADTAYLQRRVAGSCAEGSSIRMIHTDGTVECETDDDTISIYSAGAGLRLAGTTFSLDKEHLEGAAYDTRFVNQSGDTMSGTLTVNGDIDSGAGYRLGGERILAAPSSNTFLGRLAGAGHTTGSENTFLGNTAGMFNAGGAGNTFLGASAGYQNVSGNSNTFVGSASGYSNLTGYDNTFLGVGAGQTNSEGYGNTFVGNLAGNENTTGDFNTFVGESAGLSTTTGRFNTFIGMEAGNKNVSGYYNTFLGANSGTNTTGSTNTFLGFYAGYANTSGESNTFLGHWSGRGNTLGNNNTFLGYHAGNENSTGSGNVLIGYMAGYYGNKSNKLYIDNSDTNTPLLWGDFSNDILAVHGRLGVGVQPASSYQFHSKDVRSGGRAIYGESTGANAIGVWGHATGTNSTGVWGNGVKWDFYAAGDGENYGPFTGAHEVRLSEETPALIRPGMIVSVTGKAAQRKKKNGQISLSSTLPTVKLTSKAMDKAVLGVLVGEGPLHDDHWYPSGEGERFGVVNALGEGRIWVCDVNGQIEAGDYITSSDVPGYGRLQDDDLLHSYTVAKAIETVDWDEVSDSIVFKGKAVKVYLLAVVYTAG